MHRNLLFAIVLAGLLTLGGVAAAQDTSPTATLRSGGAVIEVSYGGETYEIDTGEAPLFAAFVLARTESTTGPTVTAVSFVNDGANVWRAVGVSTVPAVGPLAEAQVDDFLTAAELGGGE